MQVVCVLAVAALVVATPIPDQKYWVWSRSSDANAGTDTAKFTDIGSLQPEDLTGIHSRIEPHYEDPDSALLALKPSIETPWPKTYPPPPGQAPNSHTQKLNSPADQPRNKKLFTDHPTPGATGGLLAARAAPRYAPALSKSSGTTQSHTVDDNLFSDGPSVFEDETYTTLDKLFRDPSRAQPSGNIFTEDLGGLAPNEVFYADDDLVIIRGGGFTSGSFVEPNPSPEQSPLKKEDPVDTVSTELLPDVKRPVKLPPHSDDKYNGNTPAIIPPPLKNLSLLMSVNRATFAASPSRWSHKYMSPTHAQSQWPQNLPIHISPKEQSTSFATLTPVHTIPMAFPTASKWKTFLRHSPKSIRQAPTPITQASTKMLVSLVNDTNVNYMAPLPHINPDAELINVNARKAPGSASIPIIPSFGCPHICKQFPRMVVPMACLSGYDLHSAKLRVLYLPPAITPLHRKY